MQTLHQGSCEITLTIPVNYVPIPIKYTQEVLKY